MARKARIKSSTGIYHVLVRAISDLSLFTDEEDRQFYIDILNDLQHKGYCEVYAYALFPTHVHLLIREGTLDSATVPSCSPTSIGQNKLMENSWEIRGNSCSNNNLRVNSRSIHGHSRLQEHSSSSLSEPIGSIMKRIASAYSYFFNVKYDHYGPIYLDRFKSNPVETRDYFLKVLDHIGSQDTQCKYTCRHIPSGLIQEEKFSNSQILDKQPALLDFKERVKRVTDSKLLAFLQQNYSFTNIGEFLQREVDEQKEVISNCKKAGGSIRQIVRLTGSSYQTVFQVR